MAAKDWKELERHMTRQQIERSDERYECLRLGVLITQMRNNAQLTQGELAERMGVTQGRISQWENGDEVKFSTLQSVAAELGISIEIIGRTADHQTIFSTAGSPVD